jgi:AcrR family transcriptional regulator
MSATDRKSQSGGGRRGYTGAPRDPDRTIQAILEAATAEFTAKGLAGARVDAIAERAGVNKRMLYHYFGDKNGLYLAALEAAYTGIRTAERGLAFDLEDPEGAVRLLVRFTFGYFVDHPEFLAMLAAENLERAVNLRNSKAIAVIQSPFMSTLGEILKRGAAAGRFRPDLDPVELYITIASLGAFYLSNRWTLSTAFNRDLTGPERMEAWVRHMEDVVLSSLRTTS